MNITASRYGSDPGILSKTIHSFFSSPFALQRRDSLNPIPTEISVFF